MKKIDSPFVVGIIIVLGLAGMIWYFTTTPDPRAQHEQAPHDQVVYTVVEGDSLSTIALHFYKDGKQWPSIAAANGILNPNSIKPGQKLVIP